MAPSASDLLRWSRRFEALGERSAEAAAQEGIPSPQQCLARAMGLRALARSAGLPPPSAEPSPEDIVVYRRWARLRAAYVR